MTDLQPVLPREPVKSVRKTTSASTTESKDWTIKGLPNEIVEVSRAAAKKNGMKINAWVSRALNEAAHEKDEFKPSDPGVQDTHSHYFESHILDEMAKLRAQNDDLVQTVNSMSAILLRICAKTI